MTDLKRRATEIYEALSEEIDGEVRAIIERKKSIKEVFQGRSVEEIIAIGERCITVAERMIEERERWIAECMRRNDLGKE